MKAQLATVYKLLFEKMINGKSEAMRISPEDYSSNLESFSLLEKSSLINPERINGTMVPISITLCPAFVKILCLTSSLRSQWIAIEEKLRLSSSAHLTSFDLSECYQLPEFCVIALFRILELDGVGACRGGYKGSRFEIR
ncbi:hypothetical protein [Rheinheimera hassiensis]|uniref:hypothetical protein n=1 Tax=Rheinheimera hassiensis TaxID=1193627 RepID=UPI001F06B715|nr:hypothetical protein [Rheinheimera hassiensis]